MWREPNIDEFNRVAERVYAQLPEQFRVMCGDVVISVSEFADDEALSALGIGDPYGLLGLYQGISLDKRSVFDLPYLPDRVWLYRQPILAYAALTQNPVDEVIAHVLIHEIGHHFGLSDDDMEALEQDVGPAE